MGVKPGRTARWFRDRERWLRCGTG